jgi:hypothetical protein
MVRNQELLSRVAAPARNTRVCADSFASGSMMSLYKVAAIFLDQKGHSESENGYSQPSSRPEHRPGFQWMNMKHTGIAPL